MAVHHVHSSIEELLKFSDNKLADLFEADGAKIRMHLQVRKAAGEIYIGADTCTHFDPKLGCRCPEHEKESADENPNSWDKSDDDDTDDDNWQPCNECDLPDACEDFGCAIKQGIKAPPEW